MCIQYKCCTAVIFHPTDFIFTAKRYTDSAALEIWIQPLKLSRYKKINELKVDGGSHPSHNKKQRETKWQMQESKAEALCHVMGVSSWKFARLVSGITLKIHGLLLNRLKMVATGCRPCQNDRKQHHDGGGWQSTDGWVIVQWLCWQMSPAHHHLWSPQKCRPRHLPGWRLLSEQQTPADKDAGFSSGQVIWLKKTHFMSLIQS